MTWVVTTGEYSDYNIICACPDETAARSIAAQLNTLEDGNFNRAEEVPLLVDTSQIKAWTLTTLTAFIHPETGAVLNEHVSEYSRWSIGEIEEAACKSEITRNGCIRVRGYDGERVRKVYGEMKARAVLDDAWRAEHIPEYKPPSRYEVPRTRVVQSDWHPDEQAALDDLQQRLDANEGVWSPDFGRDDWLYSTPVGDFKAMVIKNAYGQYQATTKQTRTLPGDEESYPYDAEVNDG